MEICVKLLMDGIDLAASGKLMLMAPMTYTTGINTYDYLVIMGNREKIRALLPVFLKKDFLEGRLSQKSYMNRLKDLKNQTGTFRVFTLRQPYQSN